MTPDPAVLAQLMAVGFYGPIIFWVLGQVLGSIARGL